MQNAITIETITNLTMSSREIAELLGSRHRDVCICIERLMDSDAIEGYAAVPYTHPQNGQTYKEYMIAVTPCVPLITCWYTLFLGAIK